MFKIAKVYKHHWLKNNSDLGGAQDMVILSKPDDHVIIHSQTVKNGRMWTDMKPHDALKLLEKNNGIFKVLSHYPQKVHFDIDRKHLTLPTEAEQLAFEKKY